MMQQYLMMRKIFLSVLIGVGVELFAMPIDNASKSEDLVARTDFEICKDWQPRQIMGKDFWHLLQNISWGSELYVDGDKFKTLVPADKSIFNESGVLYWPLTITVPNSNRVSIAAMNPNIFLDLIEKRPNAPFFITPTSVREFSVPWMHFEHDNEVYSAWKKSHPNFMGFIVGEVDNEFRSMAPNLGWRWPAYKTKLEKKGDNELSGAIERDNPKARGRDDLALQMMRVNEGQRNYLFSDADMTSYMSESYCMDHLYCESSSGVVTLETTATAGGEDAYHYRHQVALFFTRGAARQYNRDWHWYVAACFLNGYDDKGTWSHECFPDTWRTTNIRTRSNSTYLNYNGPGCGLSPSLFTRDLFLGYVSGANFVTTEGWCLYLSSNTNNGGKKYDLTSPHGAALEDWFEFTKKNPDRGTSFTPVALLVPINQGYPVYGGKSWGFFNYERPDWMIDAFMFTIMPYSPVTKNGNEGCLANSPYGDIYDVIVPDTPKKPVALDVLDNYKVAVMLGKYAKSKALAERLMEYVKNGGTLLINTTQANEFFPAEFLGVELTEVPDNVRDMYAVKVKLPVRSMSDGKIFDLPETESYEMEAVKLKGATPLLEDADGKPLACRNKFGKGNVIVSTIDCLVPKTSFNGADDKVLNNLVYGKKFPFIEYFLKNIVGEVLPLEVKGDIEYGLNKLSDGWLLYLINNKGVTKFTNKEQSLDMTKTAKVEVSLRNIKAAAITELREQKSIPKDDKNNSFSIEIPPGDVRVLKIKNYAREL